jgi:hypothetical protein
MPGLGTGCCLPVLSCRARPGIQAGRNAGLSRRSVVKLDARAAKLAPFRVVRLLSAPLRLACPTRLL